MRRAFRGGRVPHFCRRAARRPRPQREAARLGRCPISPTARRSIRAGGFPRPAANKPRKPRVSAEKKTCLAAAFASRRRAGSPLRCSGPCRSIYPRRAQNIPLHCVPIPYPAVRARPPLRRILLCFRPAPHHALGRALMQSGPFQRAWSCPAQSGTAPRAYWTAKTPALIHAGRRRRGGQAVYARHRLLPAADPSRDISCLRGPFKQLFFAPHHSGYRIPILRRTG